MDSSSSSSSPSPLGNSSTNSNPRPLHPEAREQIEKTLIGLIKTAQDLSPPTIPILTSTPTPIQFSTYVRRNSPFVIRDYPNAPQSRAKSSVSTNNGNEVSVPGKKVRRAMEKWRGKEGEKHLCEKVKGKVDVAVTPDGLADSVYTPPNSDQAWFVQPATVKMTLEELFDHLHHRHPRPSKPSSSTPPPTSPNPNPNPNSPASPTPIVTLPPTSSPSSSPPIYYLQSQNSNLTSDPTLKQSGLSKDDLGGEEGEGVGWAGEALGSSPDSTNLWIGNSQSVSSLHRDPYENLYLVIKGKKFFTLVPPIEFACLYEQLYPTGTWSIDSPKSTSSTSSKSSSSSSSPSLTFSLIPDSSPPPKIPWIPLDPSIHCTTTTINSSLNNNSPPNTNHPRSSINDKTNLKDKQRARREELEEKYPRFKYCKPFEVELGEGDLLFLPGGWFHRVGQGKMKRGKRKDDDDYGDEDKFKDSSSKKTSSFSEDSSEEKDDDDEITISVNWWYDLDYEQASGRGGGKDNVGVLGLEKVVRRLTGVLDGRWMAREEEEED